MIYFHNPHFSTFYGTNLFNALTGRFNHRKYWFIGTYILRPPMEGAGILINLDQNSFHMLFTYKVPFLNRIVSLCELAVWLAINRVNPLRVPIIFSPGRLTPQDVVMVFAFDNLQRPVSLLGDLAKAPCIKVVHLTHYQAHTGDIARHAKELGTVFFAAENNLTGYPYFTRHFPYYTKDTYLLPFVPQPRFVRRTPFARRKVKCLALGTLLAYKRTPATMDVMDFFGTDCVHPMRRAIYDNRETIGDTIASCVTLFYADATAREFSAQQGPLTKVYNALWNVINAKQKTYFSFKTSDRFNEYAMFVIPEEINHLPGISWVEGMACGAAYIGINDRMYTDLGLVPGTHYIAYDNTLQGLRDVVKYYQQNTGALERIAENGYNFVRERLNGERAARVFFSDLRQLSTQAAAAVPPDRLKFHCSFVKETQ